MTRDEYDRRQAMLLTEEDWRQQVRGLARDAGFVHRYHALISEGSDPGWPDETWGHYQLPRLMVLELKRQDRKYVLTMKQADWLDFLAGLRDSGNPGLEVYGAVRPLDRDALVETLYEPLTGSQGPFLHQWCLDPGCGRCQEERSRAKSPRPAARRRGRRAGGSRRG